MFLNKVTNADVVSTPVIVAYIAHNFQKNSHVKVHNIGCQNLKIINMVYTFDYNQVQNINWQLFQKL